MAVTRTLVHAAVLETKSPAEALQRVNDLLLPDTQQGMFVTAVYGELDVENGKFTYVNAGHNPPYWVRANGDVEKLTRTAIALGVMENQSVNQKTISVNTGDTLFLYTDGLTEAFSPNSELFGEARLLDVMKSLNSNTPDETLLAIEECLNEFIETVPLGDDLTMLAIRRI
jgi:serine phosphatase RsbU (regulator of sigma subunit)